MLIISNECLCVTNWCLNEKLWPFKIDTIILIEFLTGFIFHILFCCSASRAKTATKMMMLTVGINSSFNEKVKRPHARNRIKLRLYRDFGQALSRTVELGLECGQMSAGDPYCAENIADSQSLPMDIIQPHPLSLSFLSQSPSIFLLNSPSPLTPSS